MQPPPNPEYTNWNDVWIPPMGFYCRGSLVSHEAAVKAAAQFAGVHSRRPICIGGAARLRQPHCVIPRPMIAFTPKTAGGSFDHPLRFLATWGCSGKGLRHGAQIAIPCTTATRFVPAVFVVFIMTFPTVSFAVMDHGDLLRECRSTTLHLVADQYPSSRTTTS